MGNPLTKALNDIAKLPPTKRTSSWSREAPTGAGYYWFNEDRVCHPHLVDVIHSDQDFDRLIVRFANGRREQMGNLRGFWNGPLRPPDSPRK